MLLCSAALKNTFRQCRQRSAGTGTSLASRSQIRHGLSSRAMCSTSPQQPSSSSESPSNSKSKLSLDFTPLERVRQYLLELDALLLQRSTLSTPDLTTLLIQLHDQGLQVPLEYYRAAIDVCAFRRDPSAVHLLLALAKKNISSFPSVSMSGLRLDPHEDLLEFALTKLTRHGGLSDTLVLWKQIAAESQGHSPSGKGGYLGDERVLKSMLNKSGGAREEEGQDAGLLGRLQRLVTGNCWDETPQYFCSQLSGLRDRFKELARGKGSGASLQQERARLEAVLTRAAACLPHTAARQQGSSIGSGELDAHSAAIISALKVQCLVALASAQRVLGEAESGGGAPFLAEAKAEHRALLRHEAQAAAGHLSAVSGEAAVDSGDVVAPSSCGSSSPGTNGATSSLHMTALQKGLLDILSEQREQYSTALERDGTTSSSSPLSHLLRTSLLKRSRGVKGTGPEIEGKRNVSGHDGVDVGAKYQEHNQRAEQGRRALMDLLREMAHTSAASRSSGQGQKYAEESLRLLEQFLACHHPQRRRAKHSSGSGTGTTEPLGRVLPPCCDSATVPLHKDFAMTRDALAAPHTSFASLAPRVGPLPRHMPLARATNDTFLPALLAQTLYNTTHTHPSACSSSSSSYPYPTMLSEEEGGVAYAQLSVYAKRLHDLGLKYGVDAGPHFHARWILALPLLAHSEDEGGGQLWKRSLAYAMRLRASYLELSTAATTDSTRTSREHAVAVLNHAVIAHLCRYRNTQAFYYATHLLADPDFTSGTATTTPIAAGENKAGGSSDDRSGVVLPLTWNLLLTAAQNLTHEGGGLQHQDVIFSMNAMLRHCALSLPLSGPEQRLSDMLASQGGQDIDDSFFTDCLYAKPSSTGTDGQENDPDLLMVLLKAHLALNNGYEALCVLKHLRHCGVVLPASVYQRLMRALAKHRSHHFETQRFLSSPLATFASLRVDVTADYLLQELRNDSVALSSELVCGLVGLYQFPAQWHLSRAEAAQENAPRSIAVGGVSASRQAVQQAMQLLEACCARGGLSVDEAMLVELIHVCCAGRHDDLALGVIAAARRASSGNAGEEEGSDVGGLAYDVPPSAAMFAPLVAMHCRRGGLEGLRRAEGVLALMSNSTIGGDEEQGYGVAPTSSMLGQVLDAYITRVTGEGGRGRVGKSVPSCAQLAEVVGKVISLASLGSSGGVKGGARPAKKSVLRLLGVLLHAKASSDRNRHSSDREAIAADEEVSRLLAVIVDLYSPPIELEREGWEDGGDGEEFVFYEDLEAIFREHRVELDVYDI